MFDRLKTEENTADFADQKHGKGLLIERLLRDQHRRKGKNKKGHSRQLSNDGFGEQKP